MDSPKGDLRLLQANERTMLAWLRTGIALITFGFVIARIGVWLRVIQPELAGRPEALGTAWVGAAFVALGVLTNATALFRFVDIRRAIARGDPVPVGRFPVAFGALVTLFGAVLGGYVLLRLL